MNSIARRLVLPFVGFVVAGSLALVWWLGAEEQRQSREIFAAMARTNAEFIRAQNLPLTERTARSLSEVLGVRMIFTSPEKEQRFAGTDEHGLFREHEKLAQLSLAREGEVQSDGRYEAVSRALSLPSGPGSHVILIRPISQTSLLAQPRTVLILAAFWTLSLALAWALARGIVRPLRTFAARLPRIAEENPEPIPEAERQDEIGQLARAYAETRAQLVTERTAREQAERLATLGRMATGLAHEINNPVAAIKLHAQLLEGEISGIPPERLEIILAECGKIESLVSQWMFLARPQPPQTSPCDLAEVVSSCLRVQGPAAAHARVRIVTELPRGIFVSGDRRRLAQGVANIVINAIHAMAAEGGILTVAMEPGKDSMIAVCFADTGPGFTAEALARATELFFSEKEGGMGIGLNVTAEILRAHGGELLLRNRGEGGAVVTIKMKALVNGTSQTTARQSAVATAEVKTNERDS
jgi:signal transduction histidine kinase